MNAGEHITSLDETLAEEYSIDTLKERLETAEKVLARTLWFNNTPVHELANLTRWRVGYEDKLTFNNFPEDATWSKGNAADGTLRTFVEIPPDPNNLPENLKHHFNTQLLPNKDDYINSLNEINHILQNILFEIYESDMDSHANLHVGERAHARYVSETKHTIEKYIRDPKAKYEFTAFADQNEVLKGWVDLVESDSTFEKLHSWFDENKTKKNFEELQLTLDVTDKEPINGITKSKEAKQFNKSRFIFRIVGEKEDKTKRRLALYTAYPIEEV